MPHSRYVRANTPKRVQWTKQPGMFGAALQFSQGRCAARRENWLSAREHRPGYDAKLQVDYFSANFTRRKTQNQKQTLAPWFWSGGFVFEQVLGLEPHGGEPAGLGFRYGWRVGFDDKIGAAGKGRSEKTRSPFDALKVSTGQELLFFPAFDRRDFLFWVQGSGGDRVQWTKQGAAAGAALRFLQAPSPARRKNRLSARGLVVRVGRESRGPREGESKPPPWPSGPAERPNGPEGPDSAKSKKISLSRFFLRATAGTENLVNGNPYKNQKTGFLPASQLAEYRFSFSFQTPAFAPGNGKRKMDLPRLTSASGRSPRSKFPQIPATGCSQPRRSG